MVSAGFEPGSTGTETYILSDHGYHGCDGEKVNVAYLTSFSVRYGGKFELGYI